MEVAPSPTTPRVVQHITKASSDQLLRKFAELDSDSDSDPTPARKSGASKRGGRRSTSKKKRKVMEDNSKNEEINIIMSQSREVHSLRVLERKSLLPQHYTTRERSNNKRSSFLGKHLGISRSHHHQIRGARGKSVLSAIEKTWSKTVRGASKLFMEKHYTRHRILIDDIV